MPPLTRERERVKAAVKYVRCYSDDVGTSHLMEVEEDFVVADYAPPAPPLLLSPFTAASRFGFLELPAGWHGDWHPSPYRQFFIALSGTGEVEVGDGETWSCTPGSVLLCEDTTGRGHITRVGSEAALLLAVIHLPD